MATPSQTQSRARILNSFQEISGLNIEDCIHFLNQYQWNLEDIVEAFYNKKDFKTNSTRNTNEKNEFHQKPTHDPNLGNFYTNNDRKHQAVDNDDDRYIAHLLELYGDADESARKGWRENQQHHQPQQEYHQPQEQYHQPQQEYHQPQEQYHQPQQEYHQPQEQYHQPQQQPQKNTKTEPIYHEKQKLLRCGIHSLNNLFQIPHLFTPEHLDSIVREFDKNYINNDYGTLCIGDYDLRILIEAINRCGYQVRQINYYHSELQNLPWDSYFGLLINLNGAHWFTIKNLNSIYYNLDSTFSKPSPIGQKDALVNYLIRLIHKFKNVYIFTVLQQTNQTYHS